MVVEPWALPLYQRPGRSEVEITYRQPHSYSQGRYRQLMKEYGWAEPEDLVFGRCDPDSPLRVYRNKFSYGFACAVLIDPWQRGYLNAYRQDATGLWWYAQGKNELPKDSSDERWHQLAKK